MQTAYKGVNFVYTCEALSMLENVDYTCMTTTGEHQKTFILYMADNSLVVPNPGIGFPAIMSAGLLKGEAFLEVGHALDLPGYQYHAVEQERWATLFNDRDALAV